MWWGSQYYVSKAIQHAIWTGWGVLLSTRYSLVFFLADCQVSFCFPSRKLRSWIEQQNSNFLEEQKEVKEKLAALKDKVTRLAV